jgi:hypothetical protein
MACGSQRLCLVRLSPYRRSVSGSETYGLERDFPVGFHPHLHILVSDGCFHENGMFSVSPTVDTKTLEQIFRHKMLKMLLTKSKITQDMIALLDKWRHSRFNVFFGPRILPRQEKTMENLDKAFRKNWARWIQKIYEVDPLLCPRCFSEMRVISLLLKNLKREDRLFTSRIHYCQPILANRRVDITIFIL